jgi:hypothetical protein
MKNANKGATQRPRMAAGNLYITANVQVTQVQVTVYHP